MFSKTRLLTVVLPIFFVFTSPAKAQTAVDIVRKVESMLSPPNVHARYSFVNTRIDGTITQYEVAFSIRDSEKSHGMFVKPQRDKGREVLRLGDDLWTYMPSVGRIVRIADRDSFAGGDFSNADILRVDWLKKYKAEVLKDLPTQWIIEMVANGKDSTYAKMRLWVSKQGGQPVQQLYYDSNGTLLKRCLYGDSKSFGTLTRPSHLVMENVITKQKSELVVLELTSVDKLPDARFVVDNMGK